MSAPLNNHEAHNYAERVRDRLPRRLQELREAERLSMYALWRKCGVSRDTISRIEGGETIPGVHVLAVNYPLFLHQKIVDCLSKVPPPLKAGTLHLAVARRFYPVPAMPAFPDTPQDFLADSSNSRDAVASQPERPLH